MSDREEPFLVYTTNRPHRIAFLVDINHREVMKHVEKIIEYASSKWGGKFYQIVPVSKGSISKSWIAYLAEYDPDVIETFTTLGKTTLKVLAEKTHPYTLEQSDPARPIHLSSTNPVDILPSQQNTAALWNPFDKPKIFKFDLGGYTVRTPNYIKHFVKFNFGESDATYFTENLLAKYDVTTEKAQSKKSLIKAMEHLAGWTRYIYPIDYASLPGVHYEVTESYNKETGVLFVGDKPIDVIHYWNRALISPEWLSRRKIHAWIPTQFVEDAKLLAPTKKWLEKFVDFGNGNSNNRKLIIASASVNKTTLNRYMRLLADGMYISMSIEKITDPEAPKYNRHIGINTDMKSYSVSGDTFNINLDPIDQQQGGMGGQVWMVDVQIQRHDTDGRVTPPKELWLQFPQNNNLAHATIRKIGARINRIGIPSIPMSRGKDDLLVAVTIPSNDTIVGNLLVREPDAVYYTLDIRKGVLQEAFGDYTSSQSGRLLRGFTHLFGGMMEAAHFFESTYWRRVIMTLAGEDPAGDTNLNQALRNRVRKNLPKTKNPPSEQNIDFWTNTLRHYAQQLRFETTYKRFDFFKTELEEEFRLHREKEGGTKGYTDRTERRLKSYLSWLIERNVLLTGVMNSCPHCGLKVWYSVDTIGTNNECTGCGYEFSVRAEETWWYKLNSLSGTNGAIYSQIPLILALGQLHSEARYSFFYVPPLDVYLRRSKPVLTDLDIFAIVDGKLVIGEVKNVQSLFKDADFEKLYIAASRLKPDRVILSAIDIKPNPTNEQRIKDLQARLNKFNVKVEWLELSPMILDHDPYAV